MQGKLLFIILIWFVVTPVSGETIYKWKNENGITYYSNISPPSGIDCHVTEPPAKDRADEMSTTEQEPSAAEKTAQKPPVIQAEYLLKRVEESKKAIGAIEKLIRERPHDTSLRRNLMLKKQYLERDQKALDAINGL